MIASLPPSQHGQLRSSHAISCDPFTLSGLFGASPPSLPSSPTFTVVQCIDDILNLISAILYGEAGEDGGAQSEGIVAAAAATAPVTTIAPVHVAATGILATAAGVLAAAACILAPIVPPIVRRTPEVKDP